MESNMNSSLISMNADLIQNIVKDEVLSCNAITATYGVTLTEEQALALVNTRGEALKKTGRMEWCGGVLQKLIMAFCDSPYITEDNYEETLHELTELFYGFKNETLEVVTDDQLIGFMKSAFNGRCCGALELLAGRELMELAWHIHRGHSFESFKDTKEGNYDQA